MNPREVDHRDLELVPDSARMTMAPSRLHSHKHPYFSPEEGAT